LSTVNDEEYSLLLVGFNGWNNEEIMNLINKNKRYVKYLGYVSIEKLVELYNKTSLFVYPSLYEGFGFPPLEALACGAPVMCSNVLSLPEVCGEYAFYCNPFEVDDIAFMLKKLLEDKNLREEKIKDGLNYVKRFNWDKTAKKHLEIFESFK